MKGDHDGDHAPGPELLCLSSLTPLPPAPQSASHPSDSVVPFIFMHFSLSPTGTRPESVGGSHCAGCPRALLRKATVSPVAAQRAQLLWHEPGECVPLYPGSHSSEAGFT